MKIELKPKGARLTLVLTYAEGDFEKLSKRFEQLGLEQSETTKGLGVSRKLTYFRDKENVVLNYINTKVSSSAYDDINAPAYQSHYANLAVLRIVPNEDGIVEATLPLMTVTEEDAMVTNLVAAIKALTDINREVKQEIELA
jgi:hypothetical protein